MSINTHLGKNIDGGWIIYRDSDNAFRTVMTDVSDSSALDTSDTVFSLEFYTPGGSTPKLTLTEADGDITNDDAGVIGYTLTQEDIETLARDRYLFVIKYSIGGGDVKPLAQGYTNITRETNPGTTTTSVNMNVNVDGVTINMAVTMGGGSITSSSIASALGNQSANLIYSGPSSGPAAAPSFRALADGDIPAAIARLASPNFTGTPTVPTASVLTNTTQAASTAYVQSNALVKAASGTDGLRPSVNLFNIPGINAGTTPFQFYHHGMLSGQDVSGFPNNRLISAPKGMTVINWSVNLVNNWVWSEANQRAEPYYTDLPMIGLELGGEGVLCHYTKPGDIPATAFHEINRFGSGVEGFSGFSPYTTYVPFNQFKATIFAKYNSSTTPPASTAESWWGGSNNTFNSVLNPLLWLHSEELKGTSGTFNLNEYFRMEMNASSSGAFPAMYFYKSQGTYSSKTAQGTNTITGKIGSNAYDGAIYQNTANIAFTSGGTVSSGNAGQNIVFQTSNTNTAGLANRIRISQTGSLDMFDGSAWQPGTAGQVLTSSAAGVPTWTSHIILTQVNSVSPTSPNRTVQVVIAGTTYYLHAKTTND